MIAFERSKQVAESFNLHGSLNVSMKVEPRMVACAAIRHGDGRIICGARHFDDVMREQFMNAPDGWTEAEQGFIDQHGTWMSRTEAHVVAVAARQIVRRVGGDEVTLYSENLY